MNVRSRVLMASSEPSLDRSPTGGLAGGVGVVVEGVEVGDRGREGDGGAGDQRRGRDAEHQRRQLLGHQVVVAVRRVDERGLDVVLRAAGIGQVDHVGGDADALARRHDRLDEPVELHVRARLGVVADVGHPDRAHAPDRDLVDVLPIDVGGAVQVDGRDGRAAGVHAVEGGADDLARRVRAVVVDPPERTVDAGCGEARGLLDAVVGRRVGARRRPCRARRSRRAGRRRRGRRHGRGRGRSSGRRSRRAARWRRRDARRGGEEGEEPTGQGGDGARGSGGHEGSMVFASPPRVTHAEPGNAPVRGGENVGRSPPTVRGLSPSGRAAAGALGRIVARWAVAGRPRPRRAAATGTGASGAGSSRRRDDPAPDRAAGAREAVGGRTVDVDERAVAGRRSGPRSWQSGCRPARSSCCPSARRSSTVRTCRTHTDTVIARGRGRGDRAGGGDELDAWLLPTAGLHEVQRARLVGGHVLAVGHDPAGRARRPRPLRGGHAGPHAGLHERPRRELVAAERGLPRAAPGTTAC